MRYTEYYNQPAPELGETADITVVTNAILAGEKNQSGRVESIKATYSGNLITLNSETRQSKLTKYYNGLSFTFLSPLRLEKNDAKYQIKVDNLTAQPFKVKTAVNIGELVTVIFDSTNGFISANSPIPRSSATDSDSEETVATSRAVKSLKDSINSTNITAGKGLTGGGKLGNNISIDVATANDGIIVNDNNIQLNTVNNLTDASPTKPLSAGQGKILNERKLEVGSLTNKNINAKTLYDLIEGNSGIEFDQNLLFLNDAGTKYVGKVYFDKYQKGLFKCISQTTSTTNSASYFQNISNNANSDRIGSAFKYSVQYENSGGTTSLITTRENMNNYRFICFVYSYLGGSALISMVPVKEFTRYHFGYDMRGGENADRNYSAQILYKGATQVQATGRLRIFKVIFIS